MSLSTIAEISRRATAARGMAEMAGESTLRYFRADRLRVDWKADQSPVTLADREAEQLLRDAIDNQFPDDGVLGEELGERPGNSGFRWVLDPIDGTKSFISGVPLYGTMVGLELHQQPVAGAIYFPALHEIVLASRGEGCWSGRAGEPLKPARVAAKDELSDCTLLVTEVKTFSKIGALAAYLELESATRITRSWGDCYGYYLVATGNADIMIDPVLHRWDAVAAQSIIEEAGGIFCDWRGKPKFESGQAVAANPQLMPLVLERLRVR